MPDNVRPRGFWLRGVAFSWLAAMLILAVFAGMVMDSELKAQESTRESTKLTVINDQPLMDSLHYRQLMSAGRTNVYIDGRYRLFFKSDFTVSELRQLGSMVKVC